MKLKDGDAITDRKLIEKELENFYSNMYTSKKLLIANLRVKMEILNLLLNVLKLLNWIPRNADIH